MAAYGQKGDAIARSSSSYLNNKKIWRSWDVKKKTCLQHVHYYTYIQPSYWLEHTIRTLFDLCILGYIFSMLTLLLVREYLFVIIYYKELYFGCRICIGTAIPFGNMICKQ